MSEATRCSTSFGSMMVSALNTSPTQNARIRNRITTAMVSDLLSATSWSGACTTRLPLSGTNLRYAKPDSTNTTAGMKNV